LAVTNIERCIVSGGASLSYQPRQRSAENLWERAKRFGKSNKK